MDAKETPTPTDKQELSGTTTTDNGAIGISNTTVEQETVSKDEKGCTCQSCGKEFRIDILIPDELWGKISPKPVDGFKSGGLLCGSCIMQRLEKLTEKADYWHLTKDK